MTWCPVMKQTIESAFPEDQWYETRTILAYPNGRVIVLATVGVDAQIVARESDGEAQIPEIVGDTLPSTIIVDGERYRITEGACTGITYTCPAIVEWQCVWNAPDGEQALELALGNAIARRLLIRETRRLLPDS